MRLRGLTMPAVDALERLLMADSEAVVLGAAKDVLDRGGRKAADRHTVHRLPRRESLNLLGRPSEPDRQRRRDRPGPASILHG